MNIIGAYGSLKRGCYNHLPDKMQYIATVPIVGAMDLYGRSYPRLYEAGTYPDLDSAHDLELYLVSDRTFDMLNNMERSAGYLIHHITSPDILAAIDGKWPNNNRVVTVWYMDPNFPIARHNYIKSYPHHDLPLGD